MQKIFITILAMAFLGKLFGQSEKEAAYQPHWAFYFSNLDGHLASISTDLNLASIAPVKGQAHLVYISIKMANPREDGLSSNEEADELWRIEDEITEAFDQQHLNYTYVGRVTSNGVRGLYFFGKDTLLMEKQISSTMAAFPKYEFDLGHQSDEAWNAYFKMLYPSPREMQSIQNREVVEYLESQGDDLTKPREVFHWIYFHKQSELDQFEHFTDSLGFKTNSKEKLKEPEERPFLLRISRVDKVGYDDIDAYTLLLWEKAQALNGDYDGWETTVCK